MSYSSVILSDSPQAYYRLDEASGLVAHDSSGHGYDASLPASGVTYSQSGAIVGDTDTSMLFSSTAALSLPYNLNPSTWTALSLEYWIKLSGSWQHIVITTSNTGSTILYLNGAVYTSGTGDLITIDNSIYYAGSPLSGDLDEVALYNYVLSPAQITNHYVAALVTGTPSFYASSVVSTFQGLTQSSQLTTTTGGTETHITVNAPASGTNSYIELLSQGGTSTATPVLPSPTGLGWSIPLQGDTIAYGSWTAVLTLAKSGTAMSTGGLTVRFFRRTLDGEYFPIGVTSLSSQTFSTSKTVYITNPVTAWLWQFVPGDTLYVDAFASNGATSWASDVFSVYVSSSATQGVLNDFTVYAPTMAATPPGVFCYIGASSLQNLTAYPVLNNSFTIADAVDQRSVLTLTIEDTAGNLSFVPGMPVYLGDYTQGKLYGGYLAKDQPTRPSAGSNAQLEHILTFADYHRDFDKRANGINGVNEDGTNYLNWPGGDMVADFVQSTLYEEGITGEFALESDYTQAAFAQGTLTNAAATSTSTPFTYAPLTSTPPITTNTGDLEIQRAGTQFMLSESTTADFSSGTLTNMVASNNVLKPTTQSAIKVSAIYTPLTVGQNAPSTESGGTQTDGETFINLAYVTIWSGSMTIGTNDTFNYDVWISSTSPAFMAGADIVFSDGSFLTDQIGTLDSQNNVGLFDQNGVSVDSFQDLSGYAKDCWYTRNITLTGLNGKTISKIDLFLAGSNAGEYTTYIKNCYLGSQPASPFFGTSATTTQVNPPVNDFIFGGYLASTITTSIVSVYDPLKSYRVSPVHSISSVGLVQNSSIIWTASLPSTGGPVPTYPPGAQSASSSSSNATSPAMVIMASYDGNAWLQCQNAQSLPGLPPGANVSGLSLYLKEQFAGGSDPSAIPSLISTQITINSAANTTVSDVVASYGTAAQWNTGTQTLTGPNSNGALTLSSANPITHSWTNTNNQTFLAGWNNAGTSSASGGTYTMTPGINSVGSWCSTRLNFAGVFFNGTIEVDVSLSMLPNVSAGITYRQTGWGNANNDMAYCVTLRGDGAIQFGYGANSNSNSDQTFTSVYVVSVGSISANTFYHLKVVVQGNRHKIYFNNSSTPSIDIVDSQYAAAGQVGLIVSSSASSSSNGKFKNFSMSTTTIGTWTSPSTSLSSLGTCGYNQICWTDLDSRGYPETTTMVLASVDNGSTWQQCANGAQISQLARGTNTSGMNLKIQMILSSATPNISTPVIPGLYVRVCGNFGTVVGTRISPVIPLSSVGYVAATNAMYNGNAPTNTAITVATSQDLATWSTVGNNGAGAVLPYWTPQPSPTQDLFASNTSANYTNTSGSGGSTASVTYNPALSSLTLAGGTSALYLNNAINCADVDLFADMDTSDSGGLVFRYQNASNYYELAVHDASSSSGFTNQLRLYKVSGGTRTLLGAASAVTFTRGSVHRVRVKMKGSLICVYWDGTCTQAYLDTSSPFGSGQVGLRNSGGTSRCYQLWIQPLGTDLTGQALYSKILLSTSDPSVMPQVFTVVISVRGSTIGTGATIYQLHTPAQPFAAYFSSEMDTITQASGDWAWWVDRWKRVRFVSRQARQGAFPLQSMYDPANASGFLRYVPTVQATISADLLRNQQAITNVAGLTSTLTETKAGDGSTSSWSLGYPVYSAPSITINGTPATVGIQGIDSGKQFYWQPNSVTITYDSSLPKLPNGSIIVIQYVGQSPVNVVLNNTAAQAAQQLIELNSGKIAEIESATSSIVKTMTTAQATVFGNGLLARFGQVAPIETIGTTLYSGLKPGTVVSLFLPEYNQWNVQVPIVKVTTTAVQSNNSIIYFYSIDATNGPNLSQWQRVWF